MKKLILILLFIPLVSCDKKNTIGDCALNGKVKSVVTSHYVAEEKFGEIEKGELEYILEQEFNDDGSRIEEKHTDYYLGTKETTTSTYEYEYEYEEYDMKDNWTKRVLYRDDKPYQIQEREIEYY
jgi:rRNA maturation endonuclease Nob1